MTAYLRLYGERLVELGYTVLPIKPGSKRPDIKDWPRHATTVQNVVAWYSNGRAQHGVGINTRDTPAIDVDVLDPTVAGAMADAIDAIFPCHSLLTRTGMAPKFLIPFRSDEPFRKLVSQTYTDGKNDHKVEILGDGQQFVAYAIHPGTKQSYQWFDGLSDSGIRDVARAELPVLTAALAAQVVEAFELLAAERVSAGAWTLKAGAVPLEAANNTRIHDDPFAAHSEPLSDLSRAQVETLIHKLDFDERKDWVRAGMMLHHQYNGGEEGLEIWNAWGANSSKWNEKDEQAVWDSFGQRNDAPETLRGLIKQFGQPPKHAEPTASDLAFRFYAGDDYARDFAMSPELVEDMLPAQGLGMLFGPSGTGKTFWGLDLACHIHNGVKWRDKDVVQGDVMYIAAEASRGIKKRFQAVKRINPDWVMPFVADVAPNLSSLPSIEAVRDAARAVGTPAVIVIDTLSASFEGDDSSQQDISKMLRNLKILADDLNCLVLFVHHTTKDGGSWRGSGVLFNDVDAVLETVEDGVGAERRLWVTQRKHKEGEAGKSYPFKLVISEPLALKPNGKPITSCTVEQDDYAPPTKAGKKPKAGDFETSGNLSVARHYLSVLQDEIGLSGANLDEEDAIKAIQKDDFDNKNGWEDYPDRSNIKRSLVKLVKAGKIHKEGRWIRLTE
jgi:KaiC/GvpD/RAD55 family RecA-like ATPase